MSNHKCCHKGKILTQQDLAELNYPGVRGTEPLPLSADKVSKFGRVINQNDPFDPAEEVIPERPEPPPQPKPVTEPDPNDTVAREAYSKLMEAWKVYETINALWTDAVNRLYDARAEVTEEWTHKHQPQYHNHWWFRIEKGTSIFDGLGGDRGKVTGSNAFNEDLKEAITAIKKLKKKDSVVGSKDVDTRRRTIKVELQDLDKPLGTKKDVEVSLVSGKYKHANHFYVPIHAANLKYLKLPGWAKPKHCVFVWGTYTTKHATEGNNVAGWIPLESLEKADPTQTTKLKKTLELCSACFKTYSDAATTLMTDAKTDSFSYRSFDDVRNELKLLRHQIVSDQNSFRKLVKAVQNRLKKFDKAKDGDIASAKTLAKTLATALYKLSHFNPKSLTDNFKLYFRESVRDKDRDRLDTLQKRATKLHTELSQNRALSNEERNAVLKEKYQLWGPKTVRRAIGALTDINDLKTLRMAKNGSDKASRLSDYLPKQGTHVSNLVGNLSINNPSEALIAVDIFPEGHIFNRLKFKHRIAPHGTKGVWKALYGKVVNGHADRIGDVLWYYGYSDLANPLSDSDLLKVLPESDKQILNSADATKEEKKDEIRYQRRYGWVPALALKGPHTGA